MKKIVQRLFFPALAILGYTDTQAQGVSMEWAHHFGGTTADVGNAIAVDKDRNVYVAGSFSGTSNFNTSTDYTSNGGSDLFIAKLDWSGNTLWIKTIGGTGDDAALGLKIDSLNQLYITGYFADVTDFNPQGTAYELTAAGNTDIFVAKLDNTGNVLWARNMGGADGSDEGRAIAIDANLNVYTTGVFYSTADFDPGTSSFPLTAAGSSEVFVSKLDADGLFVWAKRLGGSRLDSGEGIAVDRDGNVYTTGSFQRTADFDPGTNVYNLISGANSYDVFISKLNAAGDFVWAKQFKGNSPNMGNGIALDTAANVYTTGMFTATADFNPDPASTAVFDLTAYGGTDIYVAKLDSAGAFIWAKQLGGATAFGGDRGYSVAVDNWGNAYTTGFFSGTADFDPDATATHDLISVGSSDIFVSKLNTDGNFVWAKQLSGASAIDWGTAITIDPSSNVYTTGLFNGTVDFDPGVADYPVVSFGSTDAFVHKLFCTDTSSSRLTITAGCEGYVLNNNTFDETGTYTVIVPNNKGCDSTITLELTISVPEAIINVNGFVLGTTQAYTTYQWLFNGNMLTGATNSTYTVTENGAYTVIVTDQYGCKDTSEIYTVSNVTAIRDWNKVASQVYVYPNPTAGTLYISSPVKIDVVLTGVAGNRISRIENATSVVLKENASGLYLLHIYDKNGQLIKVEKIIKP